MINIRPISDLRSKYSEIEEIVLKEDEDVYLTKNGYGSIVVMSIDKYSNLMSKNNPQKRKEDNVRNTEIERIIDKPEKQLEHIPYGEGLAKARKIINSNKK